MITENMKARKSLRVYIEKKRLFACIISVFLVLSIFMLCTGSGNNTKKKVLGKWDDGWVDENTFQCIGIGVSQHGLTNIVTRKITACNAAQMFAEMKVVERLADAGLSNVTGEVETTVYRDTVIKQIRGFIRGGSIVEQYFNPETNECRMIYHIRAEKLQARVNEVVMSTVNP